ncbi:MAG: T9SS type A sorting domain-containing protein [Bacteroidetes bacterium]|nr:T9SS type A sorting domain-containing protein [Bacteroidota bacterium]
MTLKLLSTAALLLLIHSAKAQPTLTSNVNPANGDHRVFYRCDSVSPGASGANVTWDFTNLTVITTDTVTYASCPAAPGCATFPGSTLASSESLSPYHLYYIPSASKLSMNGSDIPQPIVYSDPEDWLRFPFTYNNNFTDTFKATFVSANYPYTRMGTSSDTADGWGTLKLPTGTFHNALRVHRVQEYIDSNNTFHIVSHYHDDLYQWYVPGIHDVVFGVTLPMTINNVSAGPTIVVYTNATPAMGVENPNLLDANLIITPNPASDRITLRLRDNSNEIMTVTLCDAMGKIVAKDEYDAAKMAQVGFETSSLPTGLYFISVRSSLGSSTRKIEILH